MTLIGALGVSIDNFCKLFVRFFGRGVEEGYDNQVDRAIKMCATQLLL